MTSAWGRGLATVTDDDVVLDTWFSEVGLGDDTAPEAFARYEAAQRHDDLRGVHIRAVRLAFPTLVGSRVRITIDAVREVRATRFATSATVVAPVALATVEIPGVGATPAPATIDSGPFQAWMIWPKADAPAPRPMNTSSAVHARRK